MLRTWDLVGRDEELRLLADTAALGRGGVVVAGAAGVGKSRLCADFLAARARDGDVVVHVRGTRSTATIPFGAFARFVPEASTTLGRLDVLRRVTDALVAHAQGARLYVGIDDAHVLDDASAALVLHLVANEIAFVVATVRSGEPAPDAVMSLWKDGLTDRIELQALGRQQTAMLAMAMLGGAVDLATARRLWDATSGNPLFLRELIHSGTECGALTGDRGGWAWEGPVVASTRLSELVEARISTAAPDERNLLELVALGEPLGVQVVQAMCGEEVLDRAERRGVVAVEVDRRRRVVRLGHPLFGEVLKATMPKIAMESLYRSLAASLEEAGTRRREDLLVLVHWKLAGRVGGLDPTLLLTAARRAMAIAAYELAARLARAAMTNDSSGVAAVVLADALYWLGRFDEAATVMNDIAPKLAAMAPTDRESAAIVHSSILFWGLGDAPAAEEVLHRAELALGSGIHRDAVSAHRASMVLFNGRIDEARCVADDVLSRGEPGSRVRAMPAAVAALGLTGDVDAASAAADDALPSAMALIDDLPQIAGEIMLGKCVALLFGGRLQEADELAGAVRDLLVVERADDFLGAWLLLLGRIALERGLVATASQLLAEGGDLLEITDPAGLLPWCLASHAHAQALRGELDHAAVLLATAESARSRAVRIYDSEILVAQAWTSAAAGHLSAARDSLQRAVACARGQHSFLLEVHARHQLVRLGWMDDIDPTDGRPSAGAPYVVLAAEHARAAASQDGPALDAAAQGFADVGMMLVAAEVSAAAAVAHADQGLRAREARSAATAEQWFAACEGARTPGRRVRTPIGLVDLTAREREIVELAARGLQTRAIATKLTLSMRTVSNHLSHAYAKLGISDRDALRDLLLIESAGAE